jgi:hypothetical protein
MTEKIEQRVIKHRRKRTPQECQYCHRQYGNLKNHILMKHQAEAPGQPLELTKDDLLGKQVKEAPPEQVTYTCNSCGAKLRKGESPCWQCHERLIWDGIE